MEKLMRGIEILNVLNENSYEAYIVGGAVRDFILGVSVGDVDITTNATPESIAKLFPSVTMEGKEYYSCRIHYEGFTYEVTTYRKDVFYEDHRHPITERAASLEEDLQRRDFTMNALVMDRNQNIIDFYHGKQDIKNRVIRMIGEPELRFEEDGLRVLRAVDFASRWNFTIEDKILNCLHKDYVKYLKEEYIIGMLDRIMHNPYENGLKYIIDYQLLQSFPFYQVLVETAFRWKYRKNGYALYYALHHFLPSNLKISKKEVEIAKNIYFWIKNEFNSIALYYGDFKVLKDAIELNQTLNQIILKEEELRQAFNTLPIHSSKDIHIDWKAYPVNLRSNLTKKLEYAILTGKVENEEIALKKYLENEE